MTVSTTVITASAADVVLAADALRAGEPVVIPTETVYGLAADATDPAAVERVFHAKARPADDPLIVHVSPGLLGDGDTLDALIGLGLVAAGLSTPCAIAARLLMAGCWPGPLTIVLPRGHTVPAAVSSGLPSVALRMPSHPTALAVITAAGRPLVAPSANRFGRISPTTAAAARTELDGRVRLIVDGGPCEVGVESTVVRIDADGGVGVLRPGAVTIDELTRLTQVEPYAVKDGEGSVASPGRTPSHYAPRTPLLVTDQPLHAWSQARREDLRTRLPHQRLGWLAWSDEDIPPNEALTALAGAPASVHVLSDGTVASAARRLYAALRTLDEEGHDLLVVQAIPGRGGLADALADRLARASHGTRPLPA